MRTESSPRFLTLAEVAEEMRVSRRTVAALVAAGRIPVFRPSPRRVVVSREDLDNYLEARRQAGGR